MEQKIIKEYTIYDEDLEKANELIGNIYDLIAKRYIGTITYDKKSNIYTIPYNDNYFDNTKIIIRNKGNKNKFYYNLYLNRLLEFSKFMYYSKEPVVYVKQKSK